MKISNLCLYLMKCSINSQKPGLLPSFEMKELWRYANRHSVSVAVAKTLLDNNLFGDETWK